MTTACFQCNGTCPSASDRLKRCMIYGARVAAHSFSSHVGSGWEEHCFTGDDRMAWTRSSVLTAETGKVQCSAWSEHWRWCSSSCCSYTGDLRVSGVVVVFRREIGFGCGLVFTEKVINRSQNAASIAAACADFIPPVCSCLGLRQFTTALQSITPSCSRFGLSAGLKFHFISSGYFTCLAAFVIVP